MHVLCSFGNSPADRCLFSCTNRLKLKDGGLVWIFGVYGKRNVVLKKYKNDELTMTLPWVGFILGRFLSSLFLFPLFPQRVALYRRRCKSSIIK